MKEETIELDFRFVKLTNGDDILCEVPLVEIEESEMLIVRYPLKISTVYDPSLDEAVYVFTPWVPFTSQQLIAINKICVVTVTSIVEDVRDIYLQKIKIFQKQKLQQIRVPSAKSKAKSKSNDIPIENDVENDVEVPFTIKKPFVN